MSGVQAVILAGGKGERLGGVRKADLRIGGVRLVERVAAALGTAALPLLMSTGPDIAGMSWGDNAIAVPDLAAPVGGPLAGLAAAVDALQRRGVDSGLLVSVAVDTPFLPAEFIAVMRDGLGAAPAAYASWGADFYPPNAIWRLEAVKALPQQVVQGAGPSSLKALHSVLGSRRVDWAASHNDNPFANLNTLGDLLLLGQTAQG